MGEPRNPENPEPITAAERMRGHRARQLGDDVPKVRPGPKPGKPQTLREASLEELIDEVSDRLTGRMADDREIREPRDTRACIPWGRPQLPDLRRPAELRVHRTLYRGVTNLGGARNLSGPLSHRSPCAAPAPTADSRSHRRRPASKASRPPGSGADRDPRPPREKGPGLRLEWESSVRRILQGSWRRAARPRRGAGGRPTNVGYTHRREKAL
jgi:hypothetical protein